MRFNEYRSAQLNGSAAPGFSSNQAMKALEETFAQTMPREMGFDYSGMSFQEKKAQEGVSSSVIFGFSLLFVFLILAALYESWTLPFSVLLSTPVAVFGAFAVLWLRRTVLGYFAAAVHGADRKRCLLADRPGDADRPGRQERDSDRRVRQGRIRKRKAAGRSGAGRRPAALAADPDDVVRLHPGLRAVVDRSGAGAVARQIMGTTVIGGMVAASGIGIFLVPAIFYLVEKLSGAASRRPTPALPPQPLPGEGD